MTWELILASISLLAAIVGVVKWWLKDRKSDEALKRERALNAEILEHQAKVRLSIEDAERRAEGGHNVADRALAGTLSDDELHKLRSGKLPDG